MLRTIDGDALITQFDKSWATRMLWGTEYRSNILKIRGLIKSAPTLDKIAHWVYINPDEVEWPKTYQCSNCEIIITTNYGSAPEKYYLYCQKCGAQMVGIYVTL